MAVDAIETTEEHFRDPGIDIGRALFLKAQEYGIAVQLVAGARGMKPGEAELVQFE